MFALFKALRTGLTIPRGQQAKPRGKQYPGWQAINLRPNPALNQADSRLGSG